MYIVVNKFQDIDGRLYNIGENYPSDHSKKLQASRSKTLSTNSNKYKKVDIKKVEK